MEAGVGHTAIVVEQQHISGVELSPLKPQSLQQYNTQLVSTCIYLMNIHEDYLREQLCVLLVQEGQGRLQALGHQA